MDVECLLGLVEVPNTPPNFNFLPNPSDFFPLAKMEEKIASITVIVNAITIIMSCLDESGATNKSKCFVDNCDAIAKGVNALGYGVNCRDLDFQYVTRIYKNELTILILVNLMT